MGLIEDILEDPRYRAEDVNIAFFNSKGNPLGGWESWLQEHQSPEDIKTLYKKNASGYGYICGYGDIYCLAFKNRLIYDFFIKEFPDVAGSFTVEAPDGRLVIFLKGDAANVESHHPHIVEVINTGPVAVSGDVKIGEELKSFKSHGEAILQGKNPQVMIDVIMDLVNEKLGFVMWPCITRLMESGVADGPAILALSNLLLQTGVGVDDATRFLSSLSVPDTRAGAIIKETERKIKEGLKPPSCRFLRKNIKFDKSLCEVCPRHIHGGESGEVSIPSSLDDVKRLLLLDRFSILHGQYYHHGRGFFFSTRIPGEPLIFILGREGYEYGYPADMIEDPSSAPEDMILVKGQTVPLQDSTIKDLLYAAETLPNTPRLADVFDRVLVRVVNHYLDFQSETEAILVTLWIIGTYLRAIFTHYPYLTFYGLRDVGKSTALSVLSHICFDGGGVISGSGSEASLFRSAESSKGLQIIDHYEVIRKSREKRTMYEQFLENAWHSHTVADRVNTNTMEVERFRVGCSVAVASRYIDTVLEEKGFVITMIESNDEELKNRSSEIESDEIFDFLRSDLIKVAVTYADRVAFEYSRIPETPGLYGRDRNKMKPFLALARILEDEGKTGLFDELSSWGAQYRLMRKREVNDIEEAILMLLLDMGSPPFTYAELKEGLEDLGFEYVHWQSIRSDLKKLNIGFYTRKSHNQTKIYVDMVKARARARQRGLLDGEGRSLWDYDESDLEADTKPSETHEETGDDIHETAPEVDVHHDNDGGDPSEETLRWIYREVGDDSISKDAIIRRLTSEYGFDYDGAERLLLGMISSNKLYQNLPGYLRIHPSSYPEE